MKRKYVILLAVFLFVVVGMAAEGWADDLIFRGTCGYGKPYSHSRYDDLKIYYYDWTLIGSCSFGGAPPHNYIELATVSGGAQYFRYRTFDSEGEPVCNSIKWWDGTTETLVHGVWITGSCPGQ